jgi:hypothetical protein
LFAGPEIDRATHHQLNDAYENGWYGKAFVKAIAPFQHGIQRKPDGENSERDENETFIFFGCEVSFDKAHVNYFFVTMCK